MANNETTETTEEHLNLSEDQQRVAESLVFSGVNYERQRLLAILEPHRGQEKSISVDVMLDIINGIGPRQEADQATEETEEQAEEQE